MPYLMEFLNYCVVESYLLIVCLSNLGPIQKKVRKGWCVHATLGYLQVEMTYKNKN